MEDHDDGKSQTTMSTSVEKTLIDDIDNKTTVINNDDDTNNVNEIRQVQSIAYDKITKEKGIENGLFRHCMKAIRTGHITSNKLRMGIVVAGMFTDKLMYRDIISCFYAVTAAAECKVNQLAITGDIICMKLQKYPFNRTKHYEQDLQNLFDNVNDWKKQVNNIVQNNIATKQYIERIQNAINGTDIAAVLFVLWGGLIIGGGAVAMKRIKKLCGENCIHLYENINYNVENERILLKEQFYMLYDSLALPNSNEFLEIVRLCRDYMDCNNTIFVTFQRNPWWYQPIYYTSIVSVGVILAIVYSKYQK